LYREPKGSILPLGGNQAYKGFGIALLLEMLAGGLSGAPCSHATAPMRSANAVFFVVIDSRQFSGQEHFLREVGSVSEHIRSCPRAEGAGETLLPGDPERREKARRQKTGLTLDDGTWKQLSELSERLKVPIPAC